MEIVKTLLEGASNDALQWFSLNEMEANPTKFQAILFDKKSCYDHILLNVADTTIKPSKTVKLLGIEIDNNLCFAKHISNICCKAGKQLSALARLSRLLDVKSKLLIFNRHGSCKTQRRAICKKIEMP